MYTASKSRAGFTIVELLIVIVVIAILAGITLLAFNGVRERAQDAALKAELKNASTNIELYKAETGNYPDVGAALAYVTGGKDSRYIRKADGYCLGTFAGGRSASVTQGGVLRDSACDVMVSTVAGAGVAGYQDGSAATARFRNTQDVAVGPDGVLYVSDSGNHRIRTISPDGTVGTLAGSGVAGNTNGTGTAAQFSSPSGLSVAADGSVYVADLGNKSIRKITPGGVVSTVTVSDSSMLGGPNDVVMSSSGVLYFTDSHRVLQVSAAGVITVLAGNTRALDNDGTGAAASFHTPTGIDMGPNGNIYVVAQHNHRIRMITPGGVTTTVAGSTQGFADGKGTSAQFAAPNKLAVDKSGVIYVADAVNTRIRRIALDGTVTTLAGTATSGYQDGAGPTAQFSRPHGVAVDDSGVVYVADYNCQRIRKIE